MTTAPITSAFEIPAAGFKGLSLRQFLSAFLLVVIFPSLLFGLVAAWQLGRHYVEEQEQQASHLAETAAEGMVNHLGGMHSSLAVLTRLPLGRDDHLSFYQVAKDVSRQVGYHITLADREGRLYLSTRQPFGTALPRRSVLDSVTQAVASGQPHVSDMYVSSLARRNYMVSLDAPVSTPDGTRIVSLSSDVEALAEALFRTMVPEGWMMAMIDGQGRFIARSLEPERWVGRPVADAVIQATRRSSQGVIYNTSVDGFRILTSYHRIPGTHWTVLTGVPLSVLSASLLKPLGLLAGGIVCAVGLTALLAFLLVQKLNRATGRLMALAQDPLSPPEQPARTPLAEFEEVSEAIKSVAARREQLAAALDMSASIIRDLDGTILHWTRGCETLYGWVAEDVLGHKVHALLRTEFPGSQKDMEAVLMGDGVWSGELVHARRDGRPLRVSAKWMLLTQEPGRTVVVETHHDLSAETRLELALRESEGRFRSTFEQAAVGIAHLDMEGHWLRMNRKLCDIVGYSRDELASLTYLDITHPEDRAINKAAVDGLRSGTLPSISLEKRYLRPDGAQVWVNVTTSMVRTADGRPDYFIAVVEDIRARKATESALAEEREVFRSLTRMSSDYFWETDREGRFTAISEPSSVDASLAYQKFIGKPRWEMPYLDTDSPAFKEHRTRLRNHQPFRHVEIGLVDGGQEYWFSVSADPYFSADGDFLGYRGVAQDITARRASQQLLEKQVMERTAELLAANKELGSFTYAASHDMRAPLSRINSFSSLLEKQYRDRLEGEGLMFLDLIRRNTVRLIALLDDLLAHAQIERKILDSQAMDLMPAVQAILHERADEIRELGAEVSLRLPGIRVLANPLGLAQVLRNLVENALKYSRGAHPPAIEIGARVRDGWCRLWVRDNGVGFDMAYHEKIFEIFRRLHTYEEFPGSGVGLALVKKAMDRMGGKVWAESAPGQGATFYIELKLAAPVTDGTVPAQAPARRRNKPEAVVPTITESGSQSQSTPADHQMA